MSLVGSSGDLVNFIPTETGITRPDTEPGYLDLVTGYMGGGGGGRGLLFLRLPGTTAWVTNARLFMRFRPVQGAKTRAQQGGRGRGGARRHLATDQIYRGPTGRRALNYNGSTALVAAEPGKLSLPAPPETTIGSGLEGKSLRNVSRGATATGFGPATS